MEKQSYLSKSRYLLLFLFALIVGSGTAWADGKSLPYSYGFEDNNLATDGWTALNPSNLNSSEFGIVNITPRTGTYKFQFSSYNDKGDTEQYLISPELNAPTGVIVSFYHRASSSTEYINVGYSTSTADIENFTWTYENLSVSSSSYNKFEETFPAGTKFIAIKYAQNWKYRVYIDDFSFTAPPSCITPTGLTTSDITSSSVVLSWTSDADTWNVQYKKATDADWTDVSGNLTSKTYTLSGLQPATAYQVRVRTYCDASDQSDWTDAVSFTTDCATLTVDATHTFSEDFSAGSLPLCWTVNNENIASGKSGWTISSNMAYSGYYGDTYLIMPAMTLGTNMQLTFDSYFGYTSDYVKSSVVLSTIGTAAADFTTTLYTFEKSELPSSSSTALPKEISLAAYNGQTVYIAFKYEGNNAHAWYVDNIVIEQGPACPKPTGLEVSNVTTQGATLSWTAGSDETKWKVIYGATGFDPASAGTTIDNVTTNPYTLTGLTAETEYDVYVKAVKGSDVSEVSNKANFTTLSAAPVIGLSTTSYNFGLVSDADAQALTLTITNSGGAALTGLTVTPSAGFAVTDAEGNALTATTIAASSTLTVKVKVSALGQQDGTITIDGNEIEAQTVNVNGYMLDNTKICETFASKPSRWTGDWYTYSAANGAYSGTSARTLTTPKITVAEGNVLAIRAKYSYIGGYLTIEGSSDNGSTWTAYTKTINYSSDPNLTNEFKLFTISDVPTTVNKLRLTGEYVYVNVFNGFTYANEPVLGLFSNEGCTTAQASSATKNFGFATEAQNQLYYIKNTGNGQIDLTIEQADGFTAAVDDAALTEGEKATLTVTMTATEGLHEGTITVTAKNHDNDATLGTFVINANGGITGSKNNVVLTAFPAGWQNNNWAINSGAARIWSSTPSDLITTTLRVTAGDKLLVEAKKYYSTDDSQLSYSYSSDNGVNWSDPVSLTSSLGTDYKIVSISGIPAGDVLMKFTGTYAYIRQIYGFEAVAEPIMEFAAAGTTKNFGMISSKTTSDAYTITNSGTATLENLSVTCDNANFEIAVADNATSIAAGSNVTFTVALKTTALGSQTGTVTISGDDVADKTFTVKGYVADGTKIFTTFAALPDRWTNTGWTFNASTGANSGSSASYLMTTPKIVVTEGQKLAISAKLQYLGSYYVTIEGYNTSTSDWTYTKTINNSQLNNSDYTIVEIDDIPTTVNRLRLKGAYVYVNGLNGFTYDDNDPQFAMFSNSECTTPIEGTTATNAWGFVNEDKSATYYIKNTGTGTMTLSKTDAPAGFAVTLGKASLGTNESTSLTIAMANDAENNEGYHGGDVVLTAKDNADNTLGTFTVTSSGVVVGSKTDINFKSLDAFPAGWETTNWSVTSGVAKTNSYSSGVLTTGTYTVAAGEKLAIEAKGNSSYTSPTLTYQYSVDGGAWTNGTSVLTYTYSTSEYKVQAITDIPVGNVKIKFTGQYVDIRRIYGYTAVLEPVMTLSPAAVSYDFGMQTAAADYVITVTNSGTADMTNLAAALTGDDADDFEVAVSKTTVPYTGENTATVTVTLKASTGYKEHNATLTISADGLANKVITLAGKTRDASKNYIDFASEIPSSFVEKGSWSVSSQYATTTSSTENSLITQPIDLAAGEKIYFDAKNPYSGSLKVRYSLNGGISWSDFVDYTAAISTSGNFSSHEIDLENSSAVTAVVEFKGRYYIQLDNIYGGVLNDEAPMISITKSAAVVENGATEAFGSIMSEATATYAITNVGNGTLTITSPVTTTGVATATVSATSLANGESATLTITMPVAAPYEYKEGAVTVKTSLGDFVINYTATVLNPNSLDEQFASGKPAGWYFGGYWKVSGAQAMQEDTGTAEDLITEQLAVAGTSDVLTFQAKKSGSSTPTFNVYTSQDRVTWTPVDLGDLTLTTSYQDVNISGLAAGDYYVKITGARVMVDNFLGWEKKNNTRDLYVTATSFPATTTKGNSATITATVTSLIAAETAETGVYAKLFINGEVEQTADAQDIALNGTKTFSFTYAIPENKTAQIKVYYSDDTEAFATAVNNMKVNYTLSQTSSEAIETGTYNVTLQRTYIDGWNTICLPFAMNSSAISEKFGAEAKVFAFDSYSDVSGLHFETVSAMDAGKPYLIYIPSVVSLGNLTFNDTEITEATAGSVEQTVTFQGTYSPKAAGTLTGKHVLNTSGKLAKATASASMKGFRAYFDAPANARMLISIDGEATGIARITVDGELQIEGVYNLNGQKVQNAKKGLYIVNGKKVVIK